MKSTKKTEQQAGPENKPKLDVFASPKQRYMASAANILAHHRIVDDPAFERAVDVTIAEYATTLVGTVQSSETAMAAGYKLQGAIRGLRQLKSLAEAEQLPERQPNPDVLRSPETKRRP